MYHLLIPHNKKLLTEMSYNAHKVIPIEYQSLANNFWNS